MEELQKRYIEFKILHQVIERTDNFFVVDGSINYLHARFNFCEDWQGVQPVAVFTAGEICKKIDVVNGECIVPWEVLQPGIRKFYVGCFAGSRITSNSARVDVNASCLGDPVDSLPPTPDVYDKLLEASQKAMEDAHRANEQLKDKIPFPPTGSIGQVLAISGLDETGRPSQVEAVDAPSGAVRTGGGYYVPELTQNDDSTVDVSFRPSRDGMEPVPDVTITLPAGRDGVDGKPGLNGTSVSVDRVIESTDDDDVNTVIFSDGNILNVKNGKTGSTGPKGEQGPKGKDGQPGQNGVSPAVTVSNIENGYRITITDANGTKTFDLLNGSNGTDGKDGADGKNGIDGKSATHEWNGTVLTISSASGTSSADLKGDKGDTGDTGPQGPKGDTGATGETGPQGEPGKDGIDGKTPVKGVDYFTEADKEELTELVREDIDIPTSLPANGGNADTVGGMTAEEIKQAAVFATGYDTYTNLWDKSQVVLDHYYQGAEYKNKSQYTCTGPVWLTPGSYIFTALYAVYGSGCANVYPLDESGTVITGTEIVGTKLAEDIYTVSIVNAGYYGFNVGKNSTASANKTDSFMLVAGSTLEDFPPKYVPYGTPLHIKKAETDPYKNRLLRKKVVFDGDSICQSGSATTGSGWASRIGEANSMTWYNVAVGGGTITSGVVASNGTYRHWVSTNLDTIYANHPDLDYLILEGGTNDADLLGEERLGAISTTNVLHANFDPTADFTQALEYLLSKAIYLYPNARIGFIVAQKMGSYSDYSTSIRRKFFDRCVEVCRKYGIPCLDLWNTCHLHPKIDKASHNDAYYMYTDGQHLSDAGYDYIAPIIEEWMRSI